MTMHPGGSIFLSPWFLLCVSVFWGNEDVDLTKSDDEEGEGEHAKLKKKLGIPELDPDALPSGQICKYLSLV